MRISTASSQDDAIANLQRRQRDLADQQSAMTSGKRINRTSDDPTGAAAAERAFVAQQRLASEQRSAQASRTAMSLAESTLGEAVDQLQSARETIVAAGNGSLSASDRGALVAQLRNVRAQLLTLANQDDGAGGHVFGGQSAGNLPFLDTPSGVVADTTAGQTQLSTQEQMPATLDGPAVWLGARSGNGVFVTGADAANTGQAWIDAGSVSDPSALTGGDYQLVFGVSGGVTSYSVLKDGAATSQTDVPFHPGTAISVDGMSVDVTGSPADGDRFTMTPSTGNLDPFGALDRAIAALSDPNASGGKVSQAVSDGLRDIDAVTGHLQAARSDAGTALNRLDAIDSRDQDRTLAQKTVQSNAEDIDMVQAVSNFQNQQTGYQAALQSYAMVQRMSLLDYLK